MLTKTRTHLRTDHPVGTAGAQDRRDVGRVTQAEWRSGDLFVATDLGREPQYFDPEQRLYASGANSGCAYVVASGLVRFERVTAAGGRRITRIAGNGDLFGQEALLRQAYRDDAVACTPLTLRRVPISLLDGADWRSGRLSLALMSSWQGTLDEAEFWSVEMTTGSSRRRVLQLLARLHHHRDEQGLIWLPKRDQMGDMLNMTLETCSRMLSALRRDGVLELVRGGHARLDSHLLGKAISAADV